MDLLIRRSLRRTKQKKLPDKIQLSFIKQLYRLLDNGYSILDALQLFQYDQTLSDLAINLEENLKAGLRIDDAFKEEGFNQTVITLLYFSHLHGNLNDSLKKCITMLEQRQEALGKLKEALRYPVILAFFFSALLIGIKQSVLPSFINLYQTQGSVSQVLNFSLFFINFILNGAILLLLLLLLCFFLWFIYRRKMTLEDQIKIYKQIPIFKHFIKLYVSYQFSVHLSSLLKTGMSPVKVFDILSKQEEVKFTSYFAQQIMQLLLQGYSLQEATDSLPLIDLQLAYIFRKNSNITNLETDLSLYIDMSQEKIYQTIIKIINLIQPLVLLVIASFIIFLYVSLMWPMFQLIQTI